MKIEVTDGIFIRQNQTDRAARDIWFVHGFGESGLSFREAFSSPLTASNNLFVPDLPGFGVTPIPAEPLSIEAITDALEALIRKVSAKRPLAIVAHSLGGIIGTWLCQRLRKQVETYISIEGNLTEADAFGCGTALKFDSAKGFHQAYTKRVLSTFGNSEAVHRYFASLNFDHAEALFALGRSGASATGEGKSGDEFARLDCPKMYYWARESAPEQTQKFIKDRNLPNRCFAECGHWPMIDKPTEFYQAVQEDL